MDRIFRIREVTLIFTGFFAEFFYEMLQSPFYRDTYTETFNELLYRRAHCSVGDVLILLAFFWITSWIWRSRAWPEHGGWKPRAFFAASAFIYSMAAEFYYVEIARTWAYMDSMPRLPMTGLGLTVVMQWLVLPWIILSVSTRLVRGSRAMTLPGPRP